MYFRTNHKIIPITARRIKIVIFVAKNKRFWLSFESDVVAPEEVSEVFFSSFKSKDNVPAELEVGVAINMNLSFVATVFFRVSPAAIVVTSVNASVVVCLANVKATFCVLIILSATSEMLPDIRIV